MSEPILSIRNLTVEIPTRQGILRPVNGVSYDIGRGEILGVVGESGAGKSMAGNAVIGLLSPPARIAEGEIHVNGARIDQLKGDAMRRLRGKEIGMVFQDPLTSLNPLLRIGDQLTETILAHLPLSRSQAEERAVQALDEVGIPGAAERVNSYPHEFSGGMRQRVVIALALCAEPSLIIADEPTTALDVSVQAQIIALLKQLCRNRGTAVMLITHDMGVIAEAADRVADVCRQAGRTGPGPRGSDHAAPPLYGRPDGIDSAGVTGQGPAAPDPRCHAASGQPAAGLRLSSALPLCPGSVQGRSRAKA